MRWLKASRRSRSWLAKVLGVSPVTLWRWIVGDRTPSLALAFAIEKATGIPASGWAMQAACSARQRRAA